MNKKSFRSITALVLTLVMILTTITPVSTAFAEGESQDDQDVVEEVQETLEEEVPKVTQEEQPAETAQEEEPTDAETPAPTQESAAENDESSKLSLSAEIADLELRIVATPINPATKVYKNGKLGKFKVIFSGEWALKNYENTETAESTPEKSDEKPAEDAAKAEDAAAGENTPAEEEEEDPAVTAGMAAYKELVDAGWTFKYDLQDKKGKVIAEDIDLEEGYKYVIPKKNTGVKLVATASKEGETSQVFETGVTEKILWTDAPKSVKATCEAKSNDVTVTWSKVKNASGYYIYRISSKKKTPKKPIMYLNSDKGRKYIDKNLPGKKTYYYYVKSVYLGEVAGASYHTSSAMSGADSVTVEKFLTCKIRPMGWHTTIRGDATLFDGKTGGGSHGTIKSGLKVEVTEKYPAKFPYGARPSRIYIKYKKGGKVVKQGWIGYGHAKGGVFGTVAYKKKKALDWPTDKKEAFVNNKEYSSPTKYLIWVSTYTQRVNIFKGKKGKWKLLKSNRCVTGTFLHSTKIGSGFSIWKHQKTRVRYFYQSTSQYYYHNLSFFSKGNSFHTVCWKVGTNRQVNFIKKTLQPGTRGCCRMYTPDATWIYNNIPMKTKVVVR